MKERISTSACTTLPTTRRGHHGGSVANATAATNAAKVVPTSHQLRRVSCAAKGRVRAMSWRSASRESDGKSLLRVAESMRRIQGGPSGGCR
ncbi:hypothetical protein GCM10012319_65570 [Comamonas sp. KCTC 72670]|nr:hypothetical protein GCM10012319_65570 [Comamonas sp. KCTC 72670]